METKSKSTVLDAFQFDKPHCNDLSCTFNFFYSFNFSYDRLELQGKVDSEPKKPTWSFFSFHFIFMIKCEVCILDKHCINFPPAI